MTPQTVNAYYNPTVNEISINLPSKETATILNRTNSD